MFSIVSCIVLDDECYVKYSGQVLRRNFCDSVRPALLLCSDVMAMVHVWSLDEYMDEEFNKNIMKI